MRKTAPGIKTDAMTRYAGAYVFVMLAFLPLAVHNGYFDITETKTSVFVFFTVIFLLCRLVWDLQTYEPGKGFLSRPDLPETAALALGAVALLASAASGFFRLSFLGNTGRWQGAGMMLLYAALFYAFRGVSLRDRDILIPLAVGLTLSGAVSVADHLGADPLGFQARLNAVDWRRYTSTLGNINFAGAYVSLVLPPAALALLRTEKTPVRLGLGALCVLGLWTGMAVRSECVVLGLGAALALLPFFAGRDAAAWRRTGLLLAGLGAAMLSFRLVNDAAGRDLSALTRILSHPAVCLALALSGAGLWLLFRKKPDDAAKTALKIYAVLLIFGALAAVLGLVLLNTVWREIPLGPLEDWLRFSESWGTDRLKVWKYCLEVYRDLPLPDKLFGGGCGILAIVDRQRRIFDDAILDTAHCEYIQLLLNWGILGLGAYLTWLAASLREALRGRRSLALMTGLGILGYAVQALVNIAQAPGICLFFVLLAAMHGASAREEPPATKKPGRTRQK